MLPSESAYVGQLQVRCAAAQRTAARRLGDPVKRADLVPRDAPPSSVLVVRKLTDPLPGQLSTDPRRGQRALGDWEQAARAALGAWYCRAERPLRGRVAGTLGAVLFADPSELLACLARDLASNQAHQHWWWRALLHRLPSLPARALLQLFEERPTEVPAALARLHAWGAAAQVVGALPPRGAARVLASVARAFDAPELAAAVLVEPAAELSQRAPPAPSAAASEQLGTAAACPASDSPSPPWEQRPVCVTLAPDLSPQQAALLGTALALAKAPHVVRGREYAPALRAWWSQAVAPWPEPQRPRHAASDSAPVACPLASPVRPAEPCSKPGEPIERFGRVRERSASIEPERAADRQPASPSETRGKRHPNDSGPSAPRQPWTRSHEASAPVRPDRESVDVHIVPEVPEGTETSMGGVLFLTNALRPLHLLEPLGSVFGARTSLSGWGTLELVARCLAADRPREWGQDPVWEVLAALDGRRVEQPAGDDFWAAGSYVLPRDWPRPRHTDSCGRRAARDWASSAARPLGLQPNPRLAQLLGFVLPHVAAWLDGRPAAGRQEDPLSQAAWFRRAGRLFVTRTHVDLVMRLDQVSVPVRLAGLDRNPGWVSELGRVITFHFE